MVFDSYIYLEELKNLISAEEIKYNKKIEITIYNS